MSDRWTAIRKNVAGVGLALGIFAVGTALIADHPLDLWRFWVGSAAAIVNLAILVTADA